MVVPGNNLAGYGRRACHCSKDVSKYLAVMDYDGIELVTNFCVVVVTKTVCWGKVDCFVAVEVVLTVMVVVLGYLRK